MQDGANVTMAITMGNNPNKLGYKMVYVCMYVYIYIYLYTNIHIYIYTPYNNRDHILSYYCTLR